MYLYSLIISMWFPGLDAQQPLFSYGKVFSHGASNQASYSGSSTQSLHSDISKCNQEGFFLWQTESPRRAVPETIYEFFMHCAASSPIYTSKTRI